MAYRRAPPRPVVAGTGPTGYVLLLDGGPVSVLVADGLHLVVLASGSRGNCTWIGDGHRGLLVDCGISHRRIRQRLDDVGLPDAPIDAVLITHEHRDHVASAGIVERQLRRQGREIEFLMTPGTAASLPPKVRPDNVRVVPAGVPIRWHDWTLEPCRIPHDTDDPVAWVVERQGVRAGVVTDLGHAPRAVRHLLAGLDLAVFEFNHDEEMLLDGDYPWPLKQRVRSRHGHLSNAAAASALAGSAGVGRLKDVILGHLSRDNNTPDLAWAAAEEALHRAGSSARLHLASQDTPTDRLHLTAGGPPHPTLF